MLLPIGLLVFREKSTVKGGGRVRCVRAKVFGRPNSFEVGIRAITRIEEFF